MIIDYDWTSPPYACIIFEINACLTITSDLGEYPSPKAPVSVKPPVTLILPPTTEARALFNALGRETRGVQTVAPERRIKTEEESVLV